MLFPDIKVLFIERETEKNEDELYLLDLEDCNSIDQLKDVIMDYHGFDDLEAANYILNQIV